LLSWVFVGGGSGPPAGGSAIGPGLAPVRRTTTAVLYGDNINHHVLAVIPQSRSKRLPCSTVSSRVFRYSTSRNRCTLHHSSRDSLDPRPRLHWSISGVFRSTAVD
jgi:hypothetical protein